MSDSEYDSEFEGNDINDSDTSDLDDVSSSDISSIEEQFAADVEAMSFEDISEEQARLDSLSQMDDMDIFAEYDAEQKEQYDPELFNSLTDGLSRESLEHLKEGLANRDPDVMDYFGLTDNDDGQDGPPDFTRKRTR